MATTAAPPVPPVNFELPNRDDPLPTITPHQVALCFLIKGYLSPAEDDAGGTWPQRQALGDALLTAIREVDTVREPTIFQLAARLRKDVTFNLSSTPFADNGEYGKLVVESLYAHMRPDNIIDRLVVLFSQLSNMVTTSTNSRAEDSVGADDNSVMGFFLRRCWCDFTALSFEETCSLAAACEMYRYGGPANTPEKYGGSLHLNVKESEDSTFRIRAVTDRFLAKHVVEAERSNLPRDLPRFEGPVKDLLNHTQNIISEGLRAQLAFSTARGDPFSAEESGHNQFDAPTNTYLQPIGCIASGELGYISRDRTRLQLAALSLASTYAKLGNVQLAMEALNEALRTAQVAKDDAALAHVLAIICQTMESATPGTIPLMMEPRDGVKKSHAHVDELLVLLRKLLPRAEQLGLPHLAAYARLAIGRHLLIYPARPLENADLGKYNVDLDLPREIPGLSGRYFPNAPKTSLAAIEISAASRYMAHLHLGSTLSAAVPMPPAANSNLACLRILKGLQDMFTSTPLVFGPCLMGAQPPCAVEVRRLSAGTSLLRGATYSTIGSTRLMLTHSTAFMQCQGRRGTTEDKAVAIAQIAVSIANNHGYKAAEQFIQVVNKKYPGSNNRVLHAARITIAHRRACHRRDIRYALQLGGQMIALGCPEGTAEEPTDPTFIGYRVEGEEMAAEAYFYGGHFKQAEQAARERVGALAEKYYQPMVGLRLLLLLAKIFLEVKAWDVAMRYALSLYTQAKEIHVDSLRAEASLIMCRIFRKRGQEKKAYVRAAQELEAVLPFIMAHGSLEVQARARLELALALMDAAETKDEITERAQVVIALLTDAKGQFELIESFRDVQNCYSLLCLVYKVLDEKESMESCQESIKILDERRADGLEVVREKEGVGMVA